MPTVDERPRECEACGGRAFYDNRHDKAGPKSPDFKCKNKRCGERYWLSKDSPDRLDGDDRPRSRRPRDDDDEPPRRRQEPEPPPRRNTPPQDEAPVRVRTWANLSRVYDRSVAIALNAWHELPDGSRPSPAELIAAAATVFIEANRQGLSVSKEEAALASARRRPSPDPAPQARYTPPPPPPPPPPPRPEEDPGATLHRPLGSRGGAPEPVSAAVARNGATRPPVQETFDDFPAALDGEDDDDLPF